MRLSVIFLAGGVGSRFKAPGGENPQGVPKQYLPLAGKPVFQYSLETLLPYGEVIVVAAEPYRHYFPQTGLRFALPGARRQDSVYSGLQQATGDWLLIHDAARPFVKTQDIDRLLQHQATGAATLASPLTFTVKEAYPDQKRVKKTLDRETLWEIFTPQLIRRDLMEKGFQKAYREELTVTDDVQLAEIIGADVCLVPALEKGNVKITTPDDLVWAHFYLCHATK